MNLLVISHTPHYQSSQGVVGWGPTIIELDYLSTLFDRLVHIAPLYDEPAPASALMYSSNRIHFHPVTAAGGERLIDKLKILLEIPAYLRAILSEMRTADAVHVRCPANISLVAVILLSLLRKPVPRWLKYAGNWRPTGREAFSYRFQRWWLSHGLARGIVTVNGTWPNQPGHVIAFNNPCISENERAAASYLADSKQISLPVNLIFVGRLDSGKGAERVIKICEQLQMQNCKFTCDIIGDGEQRPHLEQQVFNLGLRASVCFHGWLPKSDLKIFYTKAHFILLPTIASEGWPKVLSEAMAYGAVPLTSNVSSIPQVLAKAGTGQTFSPDDIAGFANAIQEYLRKPNFWKTTSLAGVVLSEQFTYEAYLTRVADVFASTWGVKLESSSHRQPT